MINIIKDKPLITEVNNYDVTLVGTNTYCTLSNGFQRDVMLWYQYVQDINMTTRYADASKLGTILECTKENEPTFCLLFITKGYNFRPHVEKDYLSYDALEKCLKLVNIKYKGKKIASPLLGTSRFDGNGNRDIIIKLFEDNLTDVDIDVYDYYQKSSQELRNERYYELKRLKSIDRVKHLELLKKYQAEAEYNFSRNKHTKR
jgi:hypothetical protein